METETETAEWIGQRVKDLRDAAGFSQAHLAKLLQKDIGTIGRIERGLRTPSIETIVQIARHTGTDLAGFFAPAIGTVIPSGNAVLPGAQLLSPSDRKLVLAMINRLNASDEKDGL